MSRPRILIIQPYVPDYRVQMFSTLTEHARASHVDVMVAAGQPSLRDAARSDAVDGFPWMRNTEERKFYVLGRELKRRLVAPILESYKPTHVIVEQALHNLDTYEIAIGAKLHNVRLAAWGHGGSYTTRVSRLQQLTKDLFFRTSSWFFVYTSGGQEYLQHHGYSQSWITVLKNSGDTRALQHDLASIKPHEVTEFQHKNGLNPGSTAIFLGGLDSRRALPFLVAAARRVETVDDR